MQRGNDDSGFRQSASGRRGGRGQCWVRRRWIELGSRDAIRRRRRRLHADGTLGEVELIADQNRLPDVRKVKRLDGSCAADAKGSVASSPSTTETPCESAAIEIWDNTPERRLASRSTPISRSASLTVALKMDCSSHR